MTWGGVMPTKAAVVSLRTCSTSSKESSPGVDLEFGGEKGAVEVYLCLERERVRPNPLRLHLG